MGAHKQGRRAWARQGGKAGWRHSFLGAGIWTGRGRKGHCCGRDRMDGAWAQSQLWAFIATALFVSVRRALEGPARRPGPDSGWAQSSGSWLGPQACTTLSSPDSPRFPPSLSSQGLIERGCGLWTRSQTSVCLSFLICTLRVISPPAGSLRHWDTCWLLSVAR